MTLPQDAPTPEPARSNALLLGLVAVTFVAATLGAAFAPYLAVHRPLLLIALSPLSRHLLLVATHTDVRAFVLIGTLRAFFAGVLGYEVGVRYGEVGVTQIERRFARLAPLLRTLRRAFGRAAVLWLALVPWPLTAALAGASAVRREHALLALLLGDTLWMLAVYRIGFAVAALTQPILEFLRAYMLEATLASVAVVVAHQVWARHRRLRALRRRGRE